MLSCANILLALLCFGIPNDLLRLLLEVILNLLIAVTAQLYHIVKQYILEQNDLV